MRKNAQDLVPTSAYSDQLEMTDVKNVSEASYWESAYHEGRDGWELGRATPPLARAVSWLGAPSGVAIALGSGRGHEARMLAEAGWPRVVGLDFAPEAKRQAELLTPTDLVDHLEWRTGDIFELGKSSPSEFALAVEHTSFCAIDPARRDEWMRSVFAALRPGGRLLALFYLHQKPDGPPFGAKRHDVEKSLKDAGFVIEREEVPADSIERRRNEEWLVLARRP